MCGIAEPEELVPAYVLLSREAINWEYGSIHCHEEISQILGLNPGSDMYYASISRAKKHLLRHGKLIRSVKGIGYETLLPNDYNPHSVEIVNQGRRKVRKAVQVLNYAPEEQMTAHARNTRRHLYDRTVSLNNEMDRRVVGLERLTRTPALRVRTTTRDNLADHID